MILAALWKSFPRNLLTRITRQGRLAAIHWKFDFPTNPLFWVTVISLAAPGSFAF